MAKAEKQSDDGRSVIRMRWTGKRPLLMHNERLADPFDPITKAIKELSGKRKKTDEDRLEIMRLELTGGLYWQEGIGACLPDLNILGALRDAAKLRRLGSATERAFDIAEQFIPLIHDGPQDPEKLVADKRFRDYRGAGIGPSRIFRARPRFNRWGVEFDLIYDANDIDRDMVILVANDAGSKTGIGDFRPRFGRFNVEVLS